ncbi:glycosyltransferase [Intrasporangium sp.]|uniref:glycosyltransferase n=1 Tax=Intrasporangium sp. TaxID=1925024 RepID=UPI00336582A6
MKIALISEHASPLAVLGGVDAGGQNVHVDALARHLGQRGHDVYVYTRRDDESLAERVALAPGVTVVHVPAGPPRAVPKDELLPYMPEFGRWLEQDWLATGPPDVAHAHFWMSGLATVQAARAVGVPVAQTFHALGTVKQRHQGSDDTSPADRIDLERQLAWQVDRIIATCSDEVAELGAMGAPVHRARVVPCGVDTALFRPDNGGDAAAEMSSADRGGRLLVVGRLVPRKGCDTVIRALAEIPGAELAIAGGPDESRILDDPEARRLLEVAREAGVADRVRLLGGIAHEDLPQHYRWADVVLSTPWYEPFGITPLEAAACGRPLVGHAVGGLLDSVIDGQTGRLVEPGDSKALAAVVRELLADPAGRAAMGAEARRRALQRFDWSIVAAATEQILADVARTPTNGSALPVPHASELPADWGDAVLGHSWLERHERELRDGLAEVERAWPLVQSWGEQLARSLPDGGRVLAAGNGGSAAEAQHLTAELVGRFLTERRPLSAISLHAESSSFTAILNDYGGDEVFARQVEAHGRPGDIVVLLSTSGTSSNVLHAAKRAHDVGLTVWALTGPAPNPLAAMADSAIAVPAGSSAAVQEVHLVIIHALCAAMDSVLAARAMLEGASGRRAS